MDDHGTRLEQARERAETRLVHLRRDRSEIVDTVRLEATDDEHDPDGSTLAWEREQLAALIGAEQAKLAAIDDALVRIEDGTYGTCDGCGEAIPVARLEVRPFAARCVACAP